jgi:carboxyl-terminal processing protease
VPLVILVGSDTVSFAEVFSGVLQEAGRAHIVGRTTDGNVETLHGYDFEDGSQAWIAQETFRPPSGTDWEETGIVPEVEIPLDWDEFTAEDDAQLEAALKLLREHASAGLGR